MKWITTIFLFTIILFQTFSSFVIQAEYYLNKGYIAKVLCINKDKPKMHCNGKCYLNRQLKEQEKQEQQAPIPKKEKFEMQAYFLPKQLSFAMIQFSIKAKYYYTEELINSTFLHPIFHPPTV